MENKKQSGIFKLLTILLCVVLAASLVFNVVFYLNNNDLLEKTDMLTESYASLTTEFYALSDVAAQSEADLLAANETIDRLKAEAAEAQETIASQASTFDTLQTEFNNLADAAAQSQAGLLATNETIDQLQADLDALLPPADAGQEPAEDAGADDTAQTQEPSAPFTPEDIVATVNGESVTGGDVLTSYEHVVNYYGEPDAENAELYYAVAMEESITLKLIKLTAAEMGVDQFTQEELDALYATSDSEWEYALSNYVSYNLTETDETTDEDRAAAYAQAEAYYGLLGYSMESLRQSYVDNAVFERVKAQLCKDVTVTDADVQAYFDAAVQADKDLYESDVDAYESQLMMFQYGYADREPWYRPEGFRFIKHILLDVDAQLLADYTDLLALSEEGTDTVTAQDVEAARAAVIQSVQAAIDEINQKLSEGISFEALISEYGTDPGMAGGEYPDGYAVSPASYGFVPEFVTGAFSVDTVGDVTGPVISEHGVHILKYMADVPAGPVELTEDMKQTINKSLTDEKCTEVLTAWYGSADVAYTGIIRSVEEIKADDAQ